MKEKLLYCIVLIGLFVCGLSSVSFAQLQFAGPVQTGSAEFVSSPVREAFFELQRQNISQAPGVQDNDPSISDELIVWDQGTGDVAIYHRQTNQTLLVPDTINTYIKRASHVFGNMVGYVRLSLAPAGSGVYFCRYDSNTNTCPEELVSLQTLPFNVHVSKTGITWVNYNFATNNMEIRWCKLDRNGCNTQFTVNAVQSGPGFFSTSEEQFKPIIIDELGLVVWHEDRNLDGVPELWGADFNDSTILQPIFNPGTILGGQSIVESNGLDLVWQNTTFNNTSPVEIRHCTLDPIMKMCSTSDLIATSQTALLPILTAEISEKYIVFNDQETIYAYDRENRYIKRVTPFDGIRQAFPSVFESDVVMEDRLAPVGDNEITFDNLDDAGVAFGTTSTTGDGVCPTVLSLDVSRFIPSSSDPTFSFNITGAPANATTQVLISLEPDEIGTVGSLGTTNIDLLNVIDAINDTTNANGEVQINYSLASFTPGTTIYAQAIVQNTASCGGSGVSLTNAVKLVVQ